MPARTSTMGARDIVEPPAARSRDPHPAGQVPTAAPTMAAREARPGSAVPALATVGPTSAARPSAPTRRDAAKVRLMTYETSGEAIGCFQRIMAEPLRVDQRATSVFDMTTTQSTPSGPGYCTASTCRRNVDNRDAHELVAHSGRQLTRPLREATAPATDPADTQHK